MIKKIVSFYTSLSSVQRVLLIVATALIISGLIFYLIYRFKLWWHKKKKIAELQAQDKYNKLVNKKKNKEEEKKRILSRYPGLENPVLNKIMKFYNIMISGDLGTGKTLFAVFFAKWRNRKQMHIDRKRYKEDVIFNAKYLADKETLRKKSLLNVSSNFLITDEQTGFVARDVKKVFTMQEKDYRYAVNIFDETHADEDLSKKGSFKNLRGESEIITTMSSMQQHHRRWSESHNIFCDQSGEHVNSDIKSSGLKKITMLGVNKWLAKKGRRKLNIKLFLNKWAWPGFIFAKPISAVNENLFLKYNAEYIDPETNTKKKVSQIFPGAKMKAVAKLFLPREWANTFAWATKKKAVFKTISKEYTRFEVSFIFDNEFHQIELGFNDTYTYDTHEGADDYAARFDADGKAKAV